MRSLAARRNAAMKSIPAGLAVAAVVGGVGAGIGAFAHPSDKSTGQGAIGGGGAGFAFGTVGGLITAMVSEKYREGGLVLAGFSLLGLVVLSVGSSIYNNQIASSAPSQIPAGSQTAVPSGSASATAPAAAA